MSELDRFDVEAMIRDARHEIRGETDRAVSALRDDLHGSITDLRAMVASMARDIEELRAQLVAVDVSVPL